MGRDDLGVFILSHGRPETIRQTIHALVGRARYTGPWWIVLDTEDQTAEEYERRWGSDRVLYFDKAGVPDFDLADNGGPRSVVVYARNAVPRLAAEHGLRYYMQLDDDYNYFAHRYPRDGALTYAYTYHFDRLLDAFVEWLETTGALTVAFAQGGDYIGGLLGIYQDQPVKRKAMNTFIARVERPIRFVGRLNEDTTTYVWRGSQGDLFLTCTDFCVEQKTTQTQTGGLTGPYRELGTYVKSFYSVLFSPSCVKVAYLGEHFDRVHHQVDWGHAVPKIVSDRYRREAA
jgi:hypothetical protein